MTHSCGSRSHDLMGQSAIFIENSQTLDASVEILPHYS